MTENFGDSKRNIGQVGETQEQVGSMSYMNFKSFATNFNPKCIHYRVVRIQKLSILKKILMNDLKNFSKLNFEECLRLKKFEKLKR